MQPPARNSVRYMVRMVAALRTVSSGMRRPKKCVCFLRRKTETAVETSTASVVVFMPPAVEPGEPPTSISRMTMARPVSLMSVRSAVLKPAVRGVTA